ncbi:MAG TPA: fatty acid desaturase [Burkholderiales bacterium]|nr:fatty acid desaturase [Burkholderiales bacterium]
MFAGAYDLPWWGYVLYVLLLTHITITAVTVYLHRHQAHRALDLHPAVSHFFRFWLWLTTGMVTREWTSVHRKHHAKCESAEDPHSPQRCGLRRVLFEGTELYRIEAAKPDTLARYGHGTPEDWVERNVYRRHKALGVSIMLVTDVVLFGVIGVTVWAAQMLWIPFLAAGVINGVGHFCGYRNFQTDDASRNIVPWGIVIGGEELHNNHHAYPTSARLSSRWYELDIAWMYIRVLQALGLAKVKTIPPQLKLEAPKPACDAATLQAVVTHRYEILTRYVKSVRRTCAREARALRDRAIHIKWRALKRWLRMGSPALAESERQVLESILSASTRLATVFRMRDELAAIWQRSTATTEHLVQQLEAWCRRAEASGIDALQDFSRQLRCYALSASR